MTDETWTVCCHLHPENGRRCQLLLGHDEVAHSWERYNAEGDVIENYEWIETDRPAGGPCA